MQSLLAQVPDGAALLECALVPDGSLALFLLTPTALHVRTLALPADALATHAAAFVPGENETTRAWLARLTRRACRPPLAQHPAHPRPAETAHHVLRLLAPPGITRPRPPPAHRARG